MIFVIALIIWGIFSADEEEEARTRRNRTWAFFGEDDARPHRRSTTKITTTCIKRPSRRASREWNLETPATAALQGFFFVRVRMRHNGIGSPRKSSLEAWAPALEVDTTRVYRAAGRFKILPRPRGRRGGPRRR